MVAAKKLGIVIFLTLLLSITGAVSVRAQTPTPREALIRVTIAENPMRQFIRHLSNAPAPIQRTHRAWLSPFLFR
jgi:hypothetical protein